MRESISQPFTPAPPYTPTDEETRARIKFQVRHPRVGFAPVTRCEDPERRWVAYWLAEEDGKSRHVLGATLGVVLEKVAAAKEEFAEALREVLREVAEESGEAQPSPRRD